MIYQRKHSSGDVLRISDHKSVNFNYPIHLHKSFELVFVWEGELTVTVGTQEHLVSAGHAVLIFPGQPHAYATERFSVITIEIFSEEYLQNLYAAYRSGRWHHPVFPFDDPDFIDELMQSREDRYMLQSLLYRIASAYARGPLTNSGIGDEHLVCRVVSYMDEHFVEELTLKALAAHFGYNYRYMSGLFHDIYGTSFPNALHSRRIALARDLLLKKRGSIAEVSEACGYQSLRSFNRNFKAVEGCSPREYLARRSAEENGSASEK